MMLDSQPRFDIDASFDYEYICGLKKIGMVPIGDELLKQVAVRLTGCVRKGDTVARFGGDEFALVLPETDSQSANLVAKRIRESLANDGKKPKLSTSVGIALYPTNGEKLDVLLHAADVNLYSMKAKVPGRARSPQRAG